MSRDHVLTDAQWALLEPLLPSSKGKQSRPFRDHRQVLEGIVFRLRTGCPWRDLPERFGPWQTVWKRHARFSKDGTWDQILAALLVTADQAGHVDWQISIDSRTPDIGAGKVQGFSYVAGVFGVSWCVITLR